MSQLLKIAVIGGESTGKSTLCAQLAGHYKTRWVQEYARDYLEQLNRPYVQNDLVHIAIGQMALEQQLKPLAKRYLFCDTTLHVIQVWSEYRYSSCDPQILEAIAQSHYDAFLVTAPDFPWQDDPLREHPEPELRAYFFSRYSSIAAESKKPYCILTGNETERFEKAKLFVEQLHASESNK
jgi:NadR type nicotinamide-nucleotide adenylyltransferase